MILKIKILKNGKNIKIRAYKHTFKRDINEIFLFYKRTSEYKKTYHQTLCFKVVNYHFIIDKMIEM